ncbi:MAG: tetratricopeptide repeat protein [Myxococcales bacterium]|nr:MAG: tetratricopeptide repeat protein [Myxococcales bacterium]
MKVSCDKCGAKFKIDDGKIPAQGLSMKCPKCQAPLLVTLAGGAAAAPEASATGGSFEEDFSADPSTASDSAPPAGPGGPSKTDEFAFGQVGEDGPPDDFFADLGGLEEPSPEAASSEGKAEEPDDFAFDEALSDLDADLKLDAQDTLPPTPKPGGGDIPDFNDDELPPLFGETTSKKIRGDAPQPVDDFTLDMPSLLENAAAELEKELSGGSDGLDFGSSAKVKQEPTPLDLPDQGFSFDDMLAGDEQAAPPSEATDDTLFEPNAPPPEDLEALPPLGEDRFGGPDEPAAVLEGLPDLTQGEGALELFYVRRKNGKEFGPFPASTVLDMIRTAKLQGNEDVRTSADDWKPIGEVAIFAEEIQASPGRQTVLDTFMGSKQKTGPDLESERKRILEESKKRRRAGSLDVVSPMKQGRLQFGKRTIIAAAVLGVLLLVVGYFQFIEEVSIIDILTGQSIAEKPFEEQLKSRYRKSYDEAQEEMARDNFQGFTNARNICLEMLKAPDFRGVQAIWALLAQIDYQILSRYTSTPEIQNEAKTMLDNLASVKTEEPEVLFASASQYLYQRRFNEAKDVLLKVLVTKPKNVKALHMIAEAYLNLPEKEAAGKYLEKVIEIDKATARTYYLQGLMHNLLGANDKAKESFAKALEKDPQHLDSQIELAGILLKDQGGFDKAERELQTIRNTFKDSMSKKQLARVHYYAAQIYLKRDEPYKVVKELTAAIENEPDNYLYNEVLGQFYLKKREHDKAQEQFGKCIENNGVEIRCHLDLGIALLRMGMPDQALFKLEAASKVAADNAELYYLMGQAYEKLFKPDKALEMYEKSIALDPNGVVYYTSAAMSYLHQENLTKAGEYIQKAKLIDANSPLVYNFLGQMHLHQGDLAKAEEEFTRASQADPNFIEARHMLAETQRRNQKYDEAVAQYEKILDIDEKDDRAYFGLGQTYHLKGDLAKAVSELEKALYLNGKDYTYLFETGRAYYEMGDLEKARPLFEKSASQAPSFPPPVFYLGRLHMDLKEYDKSAEYFEQAFNLDKDNPQNYYYFGWLMENQEKYPEAIENYDRAIALKPDFAMAYLRKGIALRAQNKFIPAIQMFNMAKKLDPSVNMALIELGDCYFEMRRHELAIARYQEALKQDPENPQAHAKLGGVFLELGQPKKAVPYLQKAVTLDANNPQAHLNLGYAYKAIRNKSDAVKEFETYLELNPTAIDKDEIEDEIYYLKNR